MKILLVSDTHLSPRARCLTGNWQVIKDWIASQSIDQMIHLGDITADGIVYPEELAFAHKAFDGIGEAPLFLPGNHDIGDHPAGPGRVPEHPVDPKRLDCYREIFGADCWWFRCEGWQCIGINAQLLATDSALEARQENWLRDALNRDSGPLALFLHKPLFRETWDDREIHERYIPFEARQRLKALLPSERLRLVVSGHAHQARRRDHDGVAHIWVPSTSFCIPDAVQPRLGDKIVGAAMLELRSNSFSLEFFTPPGMVRHNLLHLHDLYPQLGLLDPVLCKAEL